MSIAEKPDDPGRTDSPSYRAPMRNQFGEAWLRRAKENVFQQQSVALAHKYLDEIGAELADVRRQNADLVTANNSYLERARKAEKSHAALADMLGDQADLCRGYTKGDLICKTGGDYDADARFVCAFEWEGVVRFVGAIPQKRGHLFFIFNPRQVKPGDVDQRDQRDDKIDRLAQPSAPRRFRDRKRGSTYVLVGEAGLRCGSADVIDGCRLAIYRRASNGDLEAILACWKSFIGHDLVGMAELQSAGAVPDGAKLTIYRCEVDGRLWARPTAEFSDGRFEEIRAADDRPVTQEDAQDVYGP